MLRMLIEERKIRKETKFFYTSNEEINSSLTKIINDFADQFKQDLELTAEKYFTQNPKVIEDFAKIWKYQALRNPKSGVADLRVVQIKEWLIHKMQTDYSVSAIKMYAAENA